MYEKTLSDMEIDPNCIDTSETRDRSKDPVSAALKLILKRCSPENKEKGHEGLSAAASGTACKSAVVAFWRSYGYFSDYTEHPDGSFSGNPGTCRELQNLINKLHTDQVQQGTHRVTRAYQQTHEDVRSVTSKFSDPYILKALERDPSVDHMLLQAAVINCIQFGSVARSDEVLSIRVEDLAEKHRTPVLLQSFQSQRAGEHRLVTSSLNALCTEDFVH